MAEHEREKISDQARKRLLENFDLDTDGNLPSADPEEDFESKCKRLRQEMVNSIISEAKRYFNVDLAMNSEEIPEDDGVGLSITFSSPEINPNEDVSITFLQSNIRLSEFEETLKNTGAPDATKLIPTYYEPPIDGSYQSYLHFNPTLIAGKIISSLMGEDLDQKVADKIDAYANYEQEIGLFQKLVDMLEELEPCDVAKIERFKRYFNEDGNIQDKYAESIAQKEPLYLEKPDYPFQQIVVIDDESLVLALAQLYLAKSGTTTKADISTLLYTQGIQKDEQIAADELFQNTCNSISEKASKGKVFILLDSDMPARLTGPWLAGKILDNIPSQHHDNIVLCGHTGTSAKSHEKLGLISLRDFEKKEVHPNNPIFYLEKSPHGPDYLKIVPMYYAHMADLKERIHALVNSTS